MLLAALLLIPVVTVLACWPVRAVALARDRQSSIGAGGDACRWRRSSSCG